MHTKTTKSGDPLVFFWIKLGLSIILCLILVLFNQINISSGTTIQRGVENPGIYFVSSVISGIPYKTQVNDKNIAPVGKILELSLQYQQNHLPEIVIKGLVKKNGYTPVKKTSGKFTAQIINKQGKVVYSQFFDPPTILLDPPALTKINDQIKLHEGKNQAPLELKQNQFVLNLPFINNLSKLIILNDKNQTVAQYDKFQKNLYKERV